MLSYSHPPEDCLFRSWPKDRLSGLKDRVAILKIGFLSRPVAYRIVSAATIKASVETGEVSSNGGLLRGQPCKFDGRTKAMKYPVHISKRVAVVSVMAAAIILASTLLESGHSRGQAANKNTPQNVTANSERSPSEASVDLSPSQLNSIKIEPVGSYQFPVEKETVGTISFADDLSVQVFPPYQGTIIKAFVELGVQVHRGQPLYTIKSPDLIQAESALIGAAATFELTNKELARVKGLPGISERELEQAISDQQTADGALKAARDAVRVFGKTDAEIDQMIASHKIDPALVVLSPISGQVTSFNAPPGQLVQPGNGTAPYTVANVSVKWMLANVVESDIPLFHLGQPVQVKVMAYVDRVFKGKVSKIYAAVDPNTHRVTIRSEIADPKDELRPGMLANFVIRVDGPGRSHCYTGQWCGPRT